MRRQLRRWTRGIRWQMYYQKRLWPLRREAWRRCRQNLTVDPAIRPRLMLIFLVNMLTFLLILIITGLTTKHEPLAAIVLLVGFLVAFYLAHALSWRGWHYYPTYLADVLQADMERMEAENREWYLREMFGDSQPPKRLTD